jgi:hypothetical protein
MSHQTSPLYGSRTFTQLEENLVWLNYHTYVKKQSKGKTYMVEEPSHIKQLSLNHVCKIGLKPRKCAGMLHEFAPNYIQYIAITACSHIQPPMLKFYDKTFGGKINFPILGS